MIKKYSPTNNKKAFILGAGFDILFGMPSWGELIKYFKSFILVNADNDYGVLEEKLTWIENQKFDPPRTIGHFAILADKHGITRGKIKEFIKKFLDINAYKDNKQTIKDVFSKLNNSEDIFITTNFSNTFKSQHWVETFSAEVNSRMSYIPIHGTPFSAKDDVLSEIVFSETDYINPRYANRINVLNNIFSTKGVNEVHIFGYSLQDAKLLEAILKSLISKVVMYVFASSDIQRNMRCEYFHALFSDMGIDIDFISSSESDELLDEMLKNSNSYNSSEKINSILNEEKSIHEEVQSMTTLNKNELIPILRNKWNDIKEKESSEESKEVRVNEYIQEVIPLINLDTLNENLVIIFTSLLDYFPEFVVNSNNLEILKKIIPIANENKFLINFSRIISLWKDKDLFDIYFNNFDDLSVLSTTYRIFKNEEWVEFIAELFADKKILESVLKIFSKNKGGRIYIKDFNSPLKITQVRSKIFSTIINTIKNNVSFFRNINLSTDKLQEKFKYNEIYLDLYEIIETINLIKNKTNAEIGKLNAIKTEEEVYDNFEVLSWFSNTPNTIIEIFKPKKVPFVIANKMKISGDDWENVVGSGFKSSEVNLEFIVESNNLDKKTNKEIIQQIKDGKMNFMHAEFFLEYLINNEFNYNEIEKEMIALKEPNIYFGMLIHAIYKKNRVLGLNFLKNTNFIHLSTDLVLENNIFTFDDIDQLIASFNLQKFDLRKTYSIDVFINTFEGRFLEMMFRLCIENNKWQIDKISKLTKEINVDNTPLIAFIDAFKYMLLDESTSIKSVDSYSTLFFETSWYKFTWSEKFLTKHFIKVFEAYLRTYAVKNKNKNLTDVHNQLNLMLYKDDKNVKSIINLIDSLELNLCASYTIFEHKFNLRQKNIFNEIKGSKFIKSGVARFSKWMIECLFSKDDTFPESYDASFVEEFLCGLKYKIEPHTFHQYLKACELLGIDAKIIEKIIFNLKSADPLEMMRTIQPYRELDMFKFIKEKIDEDVIYKFKIFLENKNIEIPFQLLTPKGKLDT